MIDWQEAYFDLVNKVECECVQQGDLVPIWQAFKDMADTLATARAEAEALREANKEAILLIDEINKRSVSRNFHGINGPLHAKLATIRATLTRAALSKGPTQ